MIIPSGTKIYIKKSNSYPFFIKPDTIIQGEGYTVKYDVRINGVTVIYKGTTVIGNWTSLSSPEPLAILNVSSICILGKNYPIEATSNEYTSTSNFNGNEVMNAPYFYQIVGEKSTSNIYRRVVEIGCKKIILADNNLDTTYIEISTNEIILTLVTDVILE